MANTQSMQNDVIDLRELVGIVTKRKKLILFITTIITIIAIIYAYVIAKPVYAVNALIEVGQIDAKPIDNVNTIQQKLAYTYKVNSKTKRPLPYVKSVIASKKSKTILSLLVYGQTNEEASRYINTVIQDIETQYREKTNTYIASQKKHVALIEDDIKDNTKRLNTMKNELKQYNQKIITLKHEDAALAGIYALQIGQAQTNLQKLSQYISELKNKKLELALSVTSLMIKPTHIIGQVTILDHPIKPKKLLIIIVSFITSLMFSIFLAFFLEFLRGFKKENN